LLHYTIYCRKNTQPCLRVSSSKLRLSSLLPIESPDTVTRKLPNRIFELPSLNFLQLSVPKNVIPFHLLNKFTGTSATTTQHNTPKLWCRLITVSNCKITSSLSYNCLRVRIVITFNKGLPRAMRKTD